VTEGTVNTEERRNEGRTERIHGRWVYQPLNTVHQSRNVEVNQETDWAIGEREIAQKLRLVNWRHRGHRRHFNDDELLDDQVEAVRCVQFHSLIDDRYELLCHEAQFPRGQLVMQTGHVSGFQKPWAQHSVHFDCCRENWASDVIEGVRID
jgi:hypothetical protein